MTQILFLSLLISTLLQPAHAALVSFVNCSNPNLNGPSNPAPFEPIPLHFVPLGVNATFSGAPAYTLNVTVYGNVSGQATADRLPPANDTSFWQNPNRTLGKIPDQDPISGLQSTIFSRINVLGYTPYHGDGQRFCNYTVNTHCPIAPVFNDSDVPISKLPGYYMTHDMGASYGFTTLNPQIRVVSDDLAASPLSCIYLEVTPALAASTAGLLAFLPLMILILVGIATASAAVFSPWGTTDIFRWTSNYGRDADQLRLITPGFGDCLQYLQFIFLSGSLSLNYPGFYQPVVSNVAWSSLVFNRSFVNDNATLDTPDPFGLVDGLYVTSAQYGLQAMTQLVGMANDRNLWAGMIIWLVVIIAVVLFLIQLGFAARALYRLISGTREEDLRAKNIPFSAGNVIRIVFNYFLLPIVAFSMYQLVIAGKVIADNNSIAPVVVAALFIVALVAFIAWLSVFIARANPRALLFDDLPTVLLWGPLYNTYVDSHAGYAIIPILITLLRGIAIGAVQQAGIAQLVLLAMCEVVLLLTLHAIRPFAAPTSMNAYHSILSAARLTTTLLMVAFVDQLGVDQDPRGWIGYVVLLLHALVLFVGFFVHALQTIIEVLARLAGMGYDDKQAARGGLVKVFGVRQLSRRTPRNGPRSRSSMASEALMLGVDPDKRAEGIRSRSVSEVSGQVLNRQSAAMDSSVGGHSKSGSVATPYSPSMTGAAGVARSSISGAPASSVGAARTRPSSAVGFAAVPNGNRNTEQPDPFFRPPRPRRVTMELNSPGALSRGSWTSGDWTKVSSPDRRGSPDVGEAATRSGSATPLPAYLGSSTAGFETTDSNADDSPQPKIDYATREVDYYYGVRGPALSHMPTRRLKTGPGDPTGPVSSATGWFKNFFGGKTKEKGKGFEVVRSSRVPPRDPTAPDDAEIALEDQEPYHDDPAAEGIPHTRGKRTRSLELDDEGDAVGGGTRHLPQEDLLTATPRGPRRIGLGSPILPDIEAGPAIQLPGRQSSRAGGSRSGTMQSTDQDLAPPVVPRKSSKRNSSSPSSDLRTQYENHRNGSDESLVVGQHDQFRGGSPSANRGASSRGSAAAERRLSIIPASLADSASRNNSNVPQEWPLPASPPGTGSSSTNFSLGGAAHRTHLSVGATSQRLPFSGRSSGAVDSSVSHHNRTPSGVSGLSTLSGVSSASDVSGLEESHDPSRTRPVSGLSSIGVASSLDHAEQSRPSSHGASLPATSPAFASASATRQGSASGSSGFDASGPPGGSASASAGGPAGTYANGTANRSRRGSARGLGLEAPGRTFDERPSSVGFVTQHRASDHIHVVDPALVGRAMSGSTAELVDEREGS